MELALPITLSICLPCLSTPQLVENWKLDQIDHPSRRFQYLCSISIFPDNLRDILILKQSLCNNLLRGLPPAWPRLDLRFGMRARIGYECSNKIYFSSPSPQTGHSARWNLFCWITALFDSVLSSHITTLRQFWQTLYCIWPIFACSWYTQVDNNEQPISLETFSEDAHLKKKTL